MICSEGYKAFRGTMRIVPKNPNMKPYELTADWLYKPEYQCWYGKGSSFPEEICEVMVDLTAQTPNEPLTIDELREMNEEAVWVECGRYRFWAFVHVEASGRKIYLKNWGGQIAFLLENGERGNECAKIYRRKPEEDAL